MYRPRMLFRACIIIGRSLRRARRPPAVSWKEDSACLESLLYMSGGRSATKKLNPPYFLDDFTNGRDFWGPLSSKMTGTFPGYGIRQHDFFADNARRKTGGRCWSDLTQSEMEVPVSPAMPALAFSSRVMRAVLPERDSANCTAAWTLGSMDPGANWPSSM